MDDATLSRLELERKIESLMDEIEFLKKLHDEVRDATFFAVLSHRSHNMLSRHSKLTDCRHLPARRIPQCTMKLSARKGSSICWQAVAEFQKVESSICIEIG